MELEQSAFQQMLGFIGDSFLGERLFYVVKKENRMTITLLDYLVHIQQKRNPKPSSAALNQLCKLNGTNLGVPKAL